MPFITKNQLHQRLSVTVQINNLTTLNDGRLEQVKVKWASSAVIVEFAFHVQKGQHTSV